MRKLINIVMVMLIGIQLFMPYSNSNSSLNAAEVKATTECSDLGVTASGTIEMDCTTPVSVGNSDFELPIKTVTDKIWQAFE